MTDKPTPASAPAQIDVQFIKNEVWPKFAAKRSVHGIRAGVDHVVEIVAEYFQTASVRSAPDLSAVREALELARNRIEYLGHVHAHHKHHRNNMNFVFPKIDKALSLLDSVSGEFVMVPKDAIELLKLTRKWLNDHGTIEAALRRMDSVLAKIAAATPAQGGRKG